MRTRKLQPLKRTWRERIAKMKTRGYATVDDEDRIGGWQTCAVGEQWRLHPTVVVYRFDDAPQDNALGMLGARIADEIRDAACPLLAEAERRAAIEHAEEYLDAIEDRVLELKREPVEAS